MLQGVSDLLRWDEEGVCGLVLTLCLELFLR